MEQVRLVLGQMRAARTVNGDRLADSSGDDRHQAIDGEGFVVSAGDFQILARARHGVVAMPESRSPPSDGDQQRALGCIEEKCPGRVCGRRCGERDDLSPGESPVAAGMLAQMRMRRNSNSGAFLSPPISHGLIAVCSLPPGRTGRGVEPRESSHGDLGWIGRVA